MAAPTSGSVTSVAVGLMRTFVYVVLMIAAALVAGYAMTGDWGRLPFLAGQLIFLWPAVRRPPPRTWVPVLPVMGASPVMSWAKSPLLITLVIAGFTAVAGATTSGGVEHLWLGVFVSAAATAAVFLVCLGAAWRPAGSARPVPNDRSDGASSAAR